MKKSNTLIFAITASVWITGIVAVSCSENLGGKAPESKRMELDSTSQYYDQNYKVYTLEGCEYIVIGYGKDRWGSHKGNCKNPVHEYSAIDTTEKHFDCIVELCEREGNQYAITTECGILFYADKRYSKGDVLKGFVSPKHN